MKLKRIDHIAQFADALEEWAQEYANIDFDPSDFYVGITKNPQERADWHKTENYGFIETVSREIAGDVEKEMHKRGYNTGSCPDNGGDEESVFVYIYPITLNTREVSDKD